MKLKAIIFSLLIATSVLSSCGKYDEGPGLSLRSKKARVAGTWTIESYTLNGQDFTAIFTAGGFTGWEFTKDGNYTVKYTDPADNETGKWELTSSNEKIKLTPTGGTAQEGTILKLKDKSMWVEIKDGSDTEVIKFKQ
jgi:hypothetical protein